MATAAQRYGTLELSAGNGLYAEDQASTPSSRSGRIVRASMAAAGMLVAATAATVLVRHSVGVDVVGSVPQPKMAPNFGALAREAALAASAVAQSTVAAASASSATSGSGLTPHILLVVADDMGWNDISYNNDASLTNQVETPQLYELAKAGIILDKFYAFADCTPSRAALLTGAHPLKTGMYLDTVAYDSEWSLPLDFHTLPEFLRDANYSTYMVGKWDIGHFSTKVVPTARGFDSFQGYYGSAIDYDSHAVRHAQYCTTHECKVWLQQCSDRNLYDYHDGMENLANANYSTWAFESFAEAALAKHVTEKTTKSPLFLYLAHQAPHAPHSAPNSTVQYFTDRFLSDEGTSTNGWYERATFAACVKEMDDTVYSLVEQLVSLGLYDNSFIFFLSDNGAGVGATAGGSNWPLRGGKFLPYEGGIRVPAFVHSPLLPFARRGTTLSALFHITDVVPTLLELAMGESYATHTDGLYGLSQLDLLWTGNETAAPRTEILAHANVADDDTRSYWFGALILGKWKAVFNATAAAAYSPDSATYASSDSCYVLPTELSDLARDGEIALSDYFNHSSLYDLDADPYEATDLKAQHPAVFRHLATKFVEATSSAADAEYMCGCNCRDQGCDMLYQWFYEHDCFVYPWSTTMDSEISATALNSGKLPSR